MDDTGKYVWIPKHGVMGAIKRSIYLVIEDDLSRSIFMALHKKPGI